MTTLPVTDTPSRFQIPGAPGYWQQTTTRYFYSLHGCWCPVCGGVGWVWRGWFHCDSRCQALAVIADGRVFLPAGKE